MKVYTNVDIDVGNSEMQHNNRSKAEYTVIEGITYEFCIYYESNVCNVREFVKKRKIHYGLPNDWIVSFVFENKDGNFEKISIFEFELDIVLNLD